MSKHTKGPWEWVNKGGWYSLEAANGTRVADDGSACGEYNREIDPEDDGKSGANAILIAEAPAMDLALQLIACGAARIERSPSGRLNEFCFDGIRYCLNGDWNALFDVIGWDKAIAATKDIGDWP